MKRTPTPFHVPDLNASIVGDNKSNAIEITLDSGGGYRITGVDGTKVNGVPVVAIRTQSAMKFAIDMGNGNDRVSFNGTFATQLLSISTGNGNDIVSLSGTTHFGDIAIQTGNGKDSVSFGSIHGAGALSVDTGTGNDSISVTAPSQVDGTATITGGNGKNTIAGTDSLAVTGSKTIAGVAFERFDHKKKPKKAHDEMHLGKETSLIIYQ